MKQKLLLALNKSTDITVCRGSFLDGKNFVRSVLFGILQLEDESTDCFCVRPDENSPSSVSFTPDMVDSIEIGVNHNIIVIRV